MTLQANYGSHQRVQRVFAFDPASGTASVLWRNRFDGSESIETVSLGELEAIDRDGRYGDVRTEVQKRAVYVLNPEHQRAA